MKPLRIGINALYLIPGEVGGTEIYLRALLAALARIDSRNEYLVFVNHETGGNLVPDAPNFTTVPQPVRARVRPWRILWEQLGLPLGLVSRGVDVLLNPGFTAPLLCPCPQVTVFHDLQHKRHPEYFRWYDLPFWNFLLFWSARISARLIAISQTTATDLRKYYRVPNGRMQVVPLGVDPEFFEIGPRRQPEQFLLAVSTLHPHKNLDGLLRAFVKFREGHPEFRLVVCGLHGLHSNALHDLRESLGLGEVVDFPGWIPRENLLDLFRRAWAFVYPTLFEGFGIPVLEALAAGIPTACSSIEPVGSIAGEAAVQFDPQDGAAIVAALEQVTTDSATRERLAAAGPARASGFSWSATASATKDALEAVSGH
jgi:glycosyltransferase involved in cell wall biosynthesis